MKISALRKLLILLDVALLLGVLGSIWQAIDTKKKLREDETASIKSLERRLNAVTVRDPDRTKIRGYPWLIANGGNLLASYNPAPPKPDEPAEKPVTVDRTPLEDKAELVSITSGGPAPYAYVKPKGQKELPPGERRFFTINEALTFVEDARITAILPRKVIFDHQGKEVTLRLKVGVPTSSADARSSTNVVPLKDYTSGITTTPNSSLVAISPGSILGMQQAGSEEVLKGVIWGTRRLKDGKTAVEVKTVPKGSALYKGGLRGGDTVKSINGERMTGKASIMAYLRANPNLARYTVQYIRNGALNTRTITPKR